MPKAKEYPQHVRAGSVTVPIYRVRHKTSASGFAYTVAWSFAGRRTLRQFTDEAEAFAEARRVVAQLAKGQAELAEISKRDHEELMAARKLAGDMPLLAALEEWSKARQIAEGQLIAAAEAWAARQGTKIETITVKDAVTQFTEAKTKAGVDVTNSYKKILPQLVVALGARSLHTVSSRELTAWMEQRYPHPVSRNTARKRVVALWRWARKQGYLPRDAMTEAEQTEAAREETSVIGVIDVKTFGRLLELIRKQHPEYLGALVVAGFCGLRRAEVHAQQWEDVNLERKFVRVSKAKRNTPARRLVPLCDAAVAWLKLCAAREGPLCSNLAIDRIRDIGRTANFELPDNCFRHSFISHRVAQTGNVAETALEAGNSPRVIFQHYRELFTKEEGEAWFALTPAKRE